MSTISLDLRPIQPSLFLASAAPTPAQSRSFSESGLSLASHLALPVLAGRAAGRMALRFLPGGAVAGGLLAALGTGAAEGLVQWKVDGAQSLDWGNILGAALVGGLMYWSGAEKMGNGLARFLQGSTSGSFASRAGLNVFLGTTTRAANIAVSQAKGDGQHTWSDLLDAKGLAFDVVGGELLHRAPGFLTTQFKKIVGINTSGHRVSSTAQMTATLRAIETRQPQPLCVDPWAHRLPSLKVRLTTELSAFRNPGRRVWMALRTRWLDDMILHFAGPTGKHKQIVILGAGLDTRAARLPLKEAGVRFFEVDMPGTQHLKLNGIRRLKNYPVENATYVPCDFTTQDFVQRLKVHGWDSKHPTLFIWEGVSYYLPEKAIHQTLTSIAKTNPSNVVLFDYWGKLMLDPKVNPFVRIAQKAGEPLLFGSDDMRPHLEQCGLVHSFIESFGQIQKRLAPNQPMQARKHSFMAAASAEPLNLS